MCKLVVVLLIFFLSACGSGFDGIYTDPSGIFKHTFEPDGKLVLTVKGAQSEILLDEYTYKIENRKVVIPLPSEGKSMVWPILSDGSIEGPSKLLLKKENKYLKFITR